MNRTSRFAVVGIAAALTLTGCASQTEGNENAAAADSLLPAAEGATEYPLTLDTAWGETTLEERPERIVTLTADGTSTEELLALGGVPAASTAIEDTFVWLDAELVERIETQVPADPQGDPYPLETIAAADPDLIVINDDLTDHYDQLSEIAPVLSVDRNSVPEGENRWETTIPALGEALDLQQTAADAMAAYDETIAGVREEHPEFTGKTATYVVYFGKEYGMNYESTDGADPAHLLQELGFERNPKAEQFSGGAVNDKSASTVSEEQLSEIDADVLIMSDNSEGSVTDITENSLYQSLGAVTSGHDLIITNNFTDYAIDGETHQGNLPWAFARTSLLGKAWAAEQLAAPLGEKLTS